MDYYDFLDVPKAWYYTTGSPEIIIGISDGKVDTTNIDFKDKIKVFGKTYDVKGHGSGVASIAAGQGDNAYGVPGVCYDCSIYSTRYGDFKYLKQLLELSEAGAKVINCSWIGNVYYETAQAAIDEMYANGTLIVAASGNTNWKQNNQGERLYYPASYNNVISVSTAHYKHEKVSDNTLSLEGYNYANNIKHHIGRTMGFKDNDPSKSYAINQVSVATINEKVDILAPSSGVIRFSRFIKDGGTEYISVEATSPAAPFVTGTIGLMFSLDPCLPHDEVESILKFTSVNIDHIDANRPYIGMYGSGTLNVGKAVKMVYDLATPESIVHIENQHFSRWNFKLTSLSKEVVLKNQKFTDDATLDLKAKNSIIIREKTVLKPNTSGKISLQIVPGLKKECDLQLRDPGIEE
jgi:subtilisin family serine protease